MIFKKLFFQFFPAVLTILTINSIYAQSVSTKGKDFWYGYICNLGYDMTSTYTYITSETTTSGTISIPGLAWSQTFNVSANSTVRITMPSAIQPTFNEGTFNKAVHVTSCDSITVHAQIAFPTSNDATVIYPTPALKNNYMVLNYNESSGTFTGGDEILIVATENNTQIEIIPTIATDGGHPSGVPYTITLHQGETYQITNSYNPATLTGTVIKSTNNGKCVPFAVFSGNQGTNIGGCPSADLLFEQLLPMTSLGNQYILPPLKNKSTTIYRVMAIQNATSVVINGGVPISLNSGEYYQFNNNIASYVSSNNPIMIMQYAQGYLCDNVGDPSQLLIYPSAQSLKKITFNAFINPIVYEYQVNIVTKTIDAANTMLDGTNIASSFSTVPSNPSYSYAQVSVASGEHSLKNPGGLLAYVYGWGFSESFGYCAGASLKDLTNKFTVSQNPVCLGSTLDFNTISDGISTGYYWDFGDSSQTTTGINTTHSYDTEGVFTVSLTKTRPAGCDIVVKQNVSIINPFIKINQNDTTVCAGTELQLSTNINNDSVPHLNINECGDTSLFFQSYHFDNLIWSTNDNDPLINVTINSDTIIYIYGQEKSTNCFRMDSINITLSTNDNDCPSSESLMKYTFPNIFTPNGDNQNDLFKLINPHAIKSLNIIILNRWGNVIFESDKVDFNWNGKVKNSGTTCHDGTYFYKATLKGFDGTEKMEHGFIQLSGGK